MSEDDRRCQDCGTPLSRYNTAPQCAPCTSSRREVPALTMQVPPQVWFTADMRRALSQWNWQTVLTAVANETGASQTQFAELTGLSQAHISRLMSGTSRCFDIRTISQIVDGLGAPRLLAGLAPVPAWSGDNLGTQGDEEAEPMKRRTLVSASLAAPFAAVLGEVQTYVAADGARQIRLMVPELYTLDDQIGGEAVCQAAQWCLSKVDSLLNQADYNEPTGRELQSAYGEMAEMAGWLHFDAGRYEEARFYYGEALRAAQLADDLNLEVLTLASMNTLSRYQGRPREAIQLIQLAQRRAAGWAPPRLAALLAAREAVCWAQLGDAAASRNAMHRAYHVFHPDIGEEDPHWLAFFDTAELAARRATASGYLGRPEQAATAMQAAVDGLGAKFQRNRAYYSVRLGLSLLAEGDQTRACHIVAPVLPLFKDVRSGRANARLREFCHQLQTSTAPAARDLLGQVHTLQITGQPA
ncbi:helix-turn-helix domain-containing protein [Micromonospora sp. Llam7]|uniref:helix-turn-helix domain-containing protein n=1 Tax=Micromonospora tarapacensis TaxID=2835305 RepID=UPI001C82DB36|nr:helix-turn-helix domain-containing protein [Micromonospora tarapacensis]